MSCDEAAGGLICVRYGHAAVHSHRTRSAIPSDLQQLVADNCHLTFPDLLSLAHSTFEEEMVTIGTARLRQLFYKTRGGELFRGVGNVRQVKTLMGKGDNCNKFSGRLLVCVDGDHERNYVGFTTAVGEVLMAECAATATELLIMDGTFKTNVEGYELLALMGMAHQRAYPLAYILLAAV